MKFTATVVTPALALSLGLGLGLPLATGAPAQAAACSCVTHRHHHATPAHYYVPSYRAHRIGRPVVYAEPAYDEDRWAYPPPRRAVVYEEPIPEPVYRPVYEPVAYPPPPPAYIDGPGFEAVDAAYVGPDPNWRPVRRHHRAAHKAPVCRRP